MALNHSKTSSRTSGNKQATPSADALRAAYADKLAAASELTLNQHYRATGAMWPGPNVCSKVRWRIYLRKRANPHRYFYAFDAERIHTPVYR